MFNQLQQGVIEQALCLMILPTMILPRPEMAKSWGFHFCELFNI
jgi:hypothetical protein